MKDLKIKDLPEILQNLLSKQFLKRGGELDLGGNGTHWLTRIDWSIATDEERMSYAELMYPVGTVIKCFAPDNLLPQTITSYPDRMMGMTAILVQAKELDNLNNRFLYLDGKWAEIISHPEEKSTERDILKDAKISTKVYPDFKVGDAPDWTEDMISDLPNGAVLSCAMVEKDEFIYKGQPLESNYEGIRYYEETPLQGNTRMMCFTHNTKNARIVSLPNQDSVANITDTCDKKGLEIFRKSL